MNVDVEKLVALKARLNEVSDALTGRILLFEEELNKMGLGVAVWSKVTGGDSDTRLGYRRYKGQWRFMIRYLNDEGEDVMATMQDAPRALRLHAYKHRMELVSAIMAAAESLANRIEKAMEGEP